MQLVDLVARGLLYVGHLDAVLLEQQTILNKKKTKVLPLVTERMRMAEGLARQLQALGLERSPKRPQDLSTYLHAKYGESADSASGETNGAPRGVGSS